MHFKELTKFLDHLTNEYGIPGNAIKIYHGHNLLFEYGSGYADVENKIPFTTDTITSIYSCSKVITCAAALTLFEKGKFLLTDPLHYYISEYKNMSVSEKDTDGKEILRKAKKPITVRDLFTMCAGFDYNINRKAITNTRSINPDASTLEYVKEFAKEPLCFDPGDHWSYSLCHDVLGGLIEAISGKNLEDYIREAILDKCGMNNTGFTRTDEVFSKMAAQYRFDEKSHTASLIDKSLTPYIFSKNYHSGGAGIYSNADDYILFADALACEGISVTGERVLSKATIDLMSTDFLTPSQKPDFNWIQYKGYGYGLGVRTVTDKALGGILSPVGEFGWAGAAGAIVFIDPKNKLSVFYNQHMLNPPEPYVLPRIRNIIYSEFSNIIL